MKNIKFSALALIMILALGSCSKDDDDFEQIPLGIWVSIDKTDTLDFKTQNNFFKSNAFMENDNFNYQLLSKDSIEIQYRSIQFVNIEPTTHKYSLNTNELSIDFTNQTCYGFDDVIMSYQKQ